MPISDDELFNNALPAFNKQIQNNLKDGWDEFRERLDKEIKEQSRLAQEKEPKFGGRWEIDKVHIRYTVYRWHAAKIGDDFLSAFASILKPHCRTISEKCRTFLFVTLTNQYQAIVGRETSTLKRIAASMGRPDQAESMILPMQSTYYSTNTKYHDYLDLEILKHNLEMGINSPSSSEDWIKTVRSAASFDPKFVLFRYHTGVIEQNGNFFLHWISWFPNEAGELQQFSQETPEKVPASLITGDASWSIPIHNKLNANEGEEYRKRLKSLSITQLREQLALWKSLDEKKPLMSPNGMMYVGHAPIRILPVEIVEQTTNYVENSQMSQQSSRSKHHSLDSSIHKPKHQIVKDEVEKLLKSLRLEDPNTSLEKTKRVYAHQTKDTYSNVNRLYHYEPKKK